ncbi:neuronal pentraxin-2 [Hypomesus transpacificus]|uniref:neuronal pentraxin-2 n=1 Tax=Hypomesus transpacificus TaxID=137520 RepID=UPI001F07D84A|nr:neuronal pentraxin-2 [Hypomesus transpacificus]
MGHRWMFQPSFLPTPLPFILLVLFLLLSPAFGSAMPGPDFDYRTHPRFICTPLPVDADPACFPPGGPAMGASGAGGPGHHGAPGGVPNGFWGMTEEAKTTILHLRESLVQQKETILEQRESIRELTAKLAMCEGFGRGMGPQDDHHGDPSGPSPSSRGHGSHSSHGSNGHRSKGGHGKKRGKEKHGTPGDMTSSPEQMSRMLQALKERLEKQSRNTSSTTYSSSLKELLQRKINALEQQMQHRSTAALSSPDHHDNDSHGDNHDRHDDGNPGDGHHADAHHDNEHHDDDDSHHDDSHHDDSHSEDNGHDDGDEDDEEDEDDDEDDDDDDDDDSHHDNIADSHGYLPRTGYHSQGPRSGLHSNKLESVLNHLHHTGSNRKKLQSPEAFQIGFPMRTNYMYGKVKRTLLQEIFALTLCLWIKGGAGPGLGTPFSYSVPGQANELVLIEWGNNPMELLVDDKAVTLPLSLSDGKWHHVCVTWTTRDGLWEAYQDGVKRGSGEDLSAWHPIKPGGVFILGQEQDTLGGRFDATQSFVGEMSDVQMWSHALTAPDIYGLASCGSHLSGDVFAWSEAMVELHGGVTKYPFNPCH